MLMIGCPQDPDEEAVELQAALFLSMRQHESDPQPLLARGGAHDAPISLDGEEKDEDGAPASFAGPAATGAQELQGGGPSGGRRSPPSIEEMRAARIARFS